MLPSTPDWTVHKPQEFLAPSSGAWKSETRVSAWSDKSSPLGGRLLVSSRGGRG